MLHLLMLVALAFLGMLVQSSKVKELEDKLKKSVGRLDEVERVVGSGPDVAGDDIAGGFDREQAALERSEAATKTIKLVRKRLGRLEGTVNALAEDVGALHEDLRLDVRDHAGVDARVATLEVKSGELARVLQHAMQWIRMLDADALHKASSEAKVEPAILRVVGVYWSHTEEAVVTVRAASTEHHGQVCRTADGSHTYGVVRCDRDTCFTVAASPGFETLLVGETPVKVTVVED